MFKHTKTRALITAVLVGGLIAAGAAPAGAQVVERYTIEDSGSGVIGDFCGAGVDAAYTFEVTGSGTIRTRGDGELLWFHERTRTVQTFTYDGMTVTDIQPNTLSRDHEIVDNGDGTISITVLLTGGQRLIGSDGKVLAKGDGQVRLLVVIDVATDQVLSEEVIFGSTGTNDDFCEAILEHWGI
ncbi:hypothetical protein [Agrococcus jenensis]|uniref:Uncharacterized protein n=1 Tax=Agrococcus jenensis TaxID=46353 RepID=A0A3N2ATQ2_9MICO|nr:hypothetical protein [Agrococcus jenensis]ROR66404.1 hypothetical protein EDD26_1786 [Agrococcus jenensis]